MKKIFLTLALALVMLLPSAARADEGMWLLSLIGKNYADMQKAGLKLSAEDIYSINQACVKDAIVGLGNDGSPFWHFCTGEIISDQGLMTTNHHCGYGKLQEHSTVEHDYLRDGFSAPAMINVATTSIPATLPYVASFEDDDTTGWVLDNSTASNIWVIDTAAHYGDNSERALYISDDGGASNHFSGGSYAHVLAYRPITVSQNGAYDVSFDWRCAGYTSSSYNHIRAALVPTSITLPSANAASTALTGITASALPAGYIPIDGGSALNGSAKRT